MSVPGRPALTTIAVTTPVLKFGTPVRFRREEARHEIHDVFAAHWLALLVASGSFASWPNDRRPGASFPAPLYSKWADAYKKATGATAELIHGLGRGAEQIRCQDGRFRRVGRAAQDEQLAGRPGTVSTVIGGVVPVVNIKGHRPGQLKLTGETVRRHLSWAKITKWNDPAIDGAQPRRRHFRTTTRLGGRPGRFGPVSSSPTTCPRSIRSGRPSVKAPR